MSQDMLGDGALAEVAGPLKDFTERICGQDGLRWFQAFKRFLRREDPWPRFPCLKTIRLGIRFEVEYDLRSLEGERVHITDAARRTLRNRAFPVAPTETEINLLAISVAELGFEEGAIYRDICARALDIGLGLCPPEVGPQLSLQYKDQSANVSLYIAMEPINDWQDDPVIFGVYCLDTPGGRGLQHESGDPIRSYIGKSRFVFVLSRK